MSNTISMSKRVEVLMTCKTVIIIKHTLEEVSRVKQAMDEAFNAIRKVEQLMSPFIEDSDVVRINRAEAGEKIKVHPWTMEVLLKAKFMWKVTEGAYDITANALYTLWRESIEVPSSVAITAALFHVGMENILLDKDNNIVEKRKSGVTISLASIAKGNSVDRAAACLQSLGFYNFFISGGGDAYSAGLDINGAPWTMAIQNPVTKVFVREVHLPEGAAAASGNIDRPLVIGEESFGHIIDPETGIPSLMNVGAAVVARDCTTADALATATIIVASRNLADKVLSVERLANRTGVTSLLFFEGEDIYSSRGAQKIK